MRLIVFFLLFAVSAKAQLLPTPEKKSTTIVVVLENMTVEDAYRHVAAVLQDEGFELHQTDAVLMTMTTGWKKTKGFFVREWQAEASIRPAGDAVHVYLRAKVRQDLKNQPDGKLLANDGTYMVDQVEKGYNFGKDWKNLEAMAGKIGDTFLYK